MRQPKISNGMGHLVRRIERLERLTKSFRHKLVHSHHRLVLAAYQNKYYTEHRGNRLKKNVLKLVHGLMRLRDKLSYLNLEGNRRRLVMLPQGQRNKLIRMIKNG